MVRGARRTPTSRLPSAVATALVPPPCHPHLAIHPSPPTLTRGSAHHVFLRYMKLWQRLIVNVGDIRDGRKRGPRSERDIKDDKRGPSSYAHLLFHVPYMVRRLGSIMNARGDTNEATNDRDTKEPAKHANGGKDSERQAMDWVRPVPPPTHPDPDPTPPRPGHAHTPQLPCIRSHPIGQFSRRRIQRVVDTMLKREDASLSLAKEIDSRLAVAGYKAGRGFLAAFERTKGRLRGTWHGASSAFAAAATHHARAPDEEQLQSESRLAPSLGGIIATEASGAFALRGIKVQTYDSRVPPRGACSPIAPPEPHPAAGTGNTLRFSPMHRYSAQGNRR